MTRHSRTITKNPDLKDWSKEYANKVNVRFFADAAAALSASGTGNAGLMMIGLVGQRDIPGHTLRVAQSVLRWDIRPSLWSHAFLVSASFPMQKKNLDKSASPRSVPLLEVPLWPRSGRFPKPGDNGAGTARLADYSDRRIDANVALLAFKMTDQEADKVQQRARDFNFDRLRYNLWDCLCIWQAYLWSNGAAPNPLRNDVPIPSASFIEMAFEAIGLDITPMANTRNTAPEHLWNAACWWHEAFMKLKRGVRGYYVLRDKGCSIESTDEV